MFHLQQLTPALRDLCQHPNDVCEFVIHAVVDPTLALREDGAKTFANLPEEARKMLTGMAEGVIRWAVGRLRMPITEVVIGVVIKTLLSILLSEAFHWAFLTPAITPPVIPVPAAVPGGGAPPVIPAAAVPGGGAPLVPAVAMPPVGFGGGLRLTPPREAKTRAVRAMTAGKGDYY